MYFGSRVEALKWALRRIDRNVCPDALISAARDARVMLPLHSQNVASLTVSQSNSSGIGWQVPDADLKALTLIVDQLMAKAA
jgi:hypothetical protein